MMIKDDIVYAKVGNIVPYGAFITVGEYSGLIHISQISDSFVFNIEDFFQKGDRIKIKILSIDNKKKRIEASFKKVNKVRGRKCIVPKYIIGFKTLHDKLNEFINIEKTKKLSD